MHVDLQGGLFCLGAIQLYLEINGSSLLFHLLFFLSALALLGCSRLCFYVVIISLAIDSILPSAYSPA